MNLPKTSPRDEARAMFRRAILEAAAVVFVERGFHAARIQDIAERARIGVGTVYNHFEQKEDVMLALLEEHTSELASLFARHSSDVGDFAERLHARLVRVLDYKDQHRAFFALVMEHGLLGPGSASSTLLKGRKPKRAACMRDELVACMAEGVKEGALRDDYSPEEHARMFAGVLRALTLDVIRDGRGRTVDRAGDVVELFTNGARARRGAHR